MAICHIGTPKWKVTEDSVKKNIFFSFFILARLLGPDSGTTKGQERCTSVVKYYNLVFFHSEELKNKFMTEQGNVRSLPR